ncbi:MAG: hypothetical protein CMP10_04915 [Zetaproteobacteria bacterium]|nr:hypothetical protein [Pseudobdellovibrionaceae bacterium]
MEKLREKMTTSAADAKLARASELACRMFDYERLYQHQEESLRNFVMGEDALITAATGGGKSLCFGMPAILEEKTTLVISPLIALIRDQVAQWRAFGVTAEFFDSLQSIVERRQVWRNLESGQVRILYISPERLALPSFRKRISGLDFCLIAIDEAHCIPEWGHHFRPEYRNLGRYLMESFDHLPKIALTATATPTAEKEITEALLLKSPNVIRGRWVRDNLILKSRKIQKVEHQFNTVLQKVQDIEGPGIVYAQTRKRVDEIYGMLKNVGVQVGRYHSSLRDRQENQNDFLSGKVNVMVATNAFGMGINKQDIRYIIHCGIPGSAEQYIQEIGRAGRDGQEATAYLFYNPRDYHIQRLLIEKSFPDRDHLASVYEYLRAEIKGSASLCETIAVQNICAKTGLDESAITSILTWLYRLDAFSRIEVEGEPWEPEFSSARILVSRSNLGRVCATIEKRQEVFMQRLRWMRQWLESDQDKKALEMYFNGK